MKKNTLQKALATAMVGAMAMGTLTVAEMLLQQEAQQQVLLQQAPQQVLRQLLLPALTALLQ